MTENIFTIICIVLFFIYLFYLSSNKETKKEKLGDAVGSMAKSTADTITSIAHNITEPQEKKLHRLAEESLASKNGIIYRSHHNFTDKSYLDNLFKIDNSFKKDLEILKVSPDKWTHVAWNLYFIGIIRFYSRDHLDYSKKNSSSYRKHIIENWENDNSLKDCLITIKCALKHFKIDNDDWVKYGDTVLDMNNIYDNEDLRTIGIVCAILPKENNYHLL